MKKTIKLTENKFHNLIKESVKKILREYQFDNDIDYNSIYEQALDLLSGGGEPSGYGWRDVAEAMGFRLDSLGPNDMETMKDAIEDAMMDTSGLANETKLRGFVRETVKKILREGFEKPSNWTDTPWKGTYQDETGALYMPDDDFENFEDEPGYYKGYHLEMDNNDPSFPHYQIISPNGEPCGGAWTFTDMQEYVDGLGQ